MNTAVTHTFMLAERLYTNNHALRETQTNRYAGFNEGSLDNYSFVAIRHKVTSYGQRRLCIKPQIRTQGVF